ncbi:MAG: NADH-quinone oxidoreductase subunit L [Anaerolineales bacterium]|nr:NADH-quinone oxidoreductase subunit L [Anaerolineales bacterium]
MLLSEATSVGGFFNLAPMVVFFPIIGLLINIIFGGRLPEKAIGWLASLASGLSFVTAVLLAISLAGHPEAVTVPLVDWITIGELELPWAFRVDTLSVTMMLAVGGVGTLIHIYAIGYMHEDVRHHNDPGRFRRFFVFFNLFIATMMLLVSADNYLMLFVGWEGVGLCSYLLIGFWYDKGKDGIGNAIAGKKAFITNRIGDFGFLIAAFLMFQHFGTFQFDEIAAKAPEVAALAPAAILAMTLFMLLGVTGKSAQLPLFVWLPDAMAGPTPVSALIHAATMVTAGVYLVARSFALYSLVPLAQTWVAMVGGITALFAATIAVGQFDIKKVLAYSTISQLGFMVAAVGLGGFVAGMFHLVTHAFFKALLFLSSGSVIQGLERGEHHVEHDPALRRRMKQELRGQHFDPQDMRNMGGLRTRMKTTFVVYLIGTLALAGIFPLAGFWSKDEILLEAQQLNITVYILLTIAAFFTAFYMGRQIILVFFGKPRSEPAAHAQESPAVMTVPLMILAALSALGGILNLPYLHTFKEWLGHTLGEVSHAAEGAAEAVEGAVETAAHSATAWYDLGGLDLRVALISTILALVAIALAVWMYTRRYQALQSLPVAQRPDDPLRGLLGPVFKVLENKYWVDEIYNAILLNRYVDLARFLAEKVDWDFWHDFFHDTIIAGGYRGLCWLFAKPIDLGIIDGIANGLAEGMQGLAAAMRRLQTGFVRNYALAVFVGVIVIIGYLVFRLM